MRRDMKNSVPVWIISVLGLLLLFSWLGSHALPGNQTTQIEGTSAAGEALIGGHFELVNAQGFTMTEKNFSGKYMLIFFGFTHCPDVCPTSLMVIKNALDMLTPEANAKITPIFVTLDPERDTPKVIGEYAQHFDDKLVALTGSPAQIKQAADAYKVYYAKVPNKKSPANYMMDHSGFIYLMGPDGKYITHFPYNITAEKLHTALAKNLQ